MSDYAAIALAIHPTTGEVYVAGSDRLPPTFLKPLAERDVQQVFYGGDRVFSSDAFVARLNSNLTQILQSTYLGGSSARMRPEPLPFIPKRARSTWRDIPFPPTFLKLLVGRRPSATSVLPPEDTSTVTPLWQGCLLI
jgi:hypothetical protein